MKRSRQLLRKLLLASLVSIFVFVGVLPGQVNADPLNLTEQASPTLTEEAPSTLTKPRLRKRWRKRWRKRLEQLGLPPGVDLMSLPTGQAAGLAQPDFCPTEGTSGIELENPPDWYTSETSTLTVKKVKPLTIADVQFTSAFLYIKDSGDPDYIPPTIHVDPAVKENKNEIHLKLINNLKNENDNTNFHYHGFQVSPQEGSDDVLKQVEPDGGEYKMNFIVDERHQPGLDWYHPHYHGNTSKQVGKGMAGLIIVDGMESYYPAVDGLDQKVMLFKGLESLQPQPSLQERFYNALKLLVGVSLPENPDDLDEANPIENKIQELLEEIPETYNCFTINGQLKPQITIQSGESQFWRMANANSSIYLNLVLAKVIDGGYEPQPLQVLGLDGYPTESALEKNSILLPPGSRAELLVGNLEEGETYKLISIGAKKTLNDDEDPYYNYLSGSLDQGKAQYILATVTPEGTPVSGSIDLQPQTENWLLPTPEDLVDNTAGDPITEQSESPFYFSDNGVDFTINGIVYHGDEDDIINVPAGTIQDWELNNETDDLHTFHIHQTHFVVTKSSFCEKEEEENGECDGSDDWTPEEYTYRDNIDLPAHKIITVRIPFINTEIVTGGEDEGKFVFHCHVLAHEDSGMMREVSVKRSSGETPTDE